MRRFIAKSMPLALLTLLPLTAAAHAESAQQSVPFDTAELYVEFNDTDKDVGVQLKADGLSWKRFRLFGPDGAQLLDIDPDGSLQDQGLTELFWESSEPSLRDVSLEEFKARFPEGTYRFVGRSIDGERLRGAATLSHVIPNGPVLIRPAEGAITDRKRTIIEWERGPQPANVDIAGYEVVVVHIDSGREFKADLAAGRAKVRVPKQFLKAGADYEFEVLAIDRSGNQSIRSSEFSTKGG